MRVVFKTSSGLEYTLEMTPTEAETILAGVNFSRRNANISNFTDTEERTVEFRTTDITSIEFIY